MTSVLLALAVAAAPSLLFVKVEDACLIEVDLALKEVKP